MREERTATLSERLLKLQDNNFWIYDHSHEVLIENILNLEDKYYIRTILINFSPILNLLRQNKSTTALNISKTFMRKK